MSVDNDLREFRAKLTRMRRDIDLIRAGTTETRPAPRFVSNGPGPWQALYPILEPDWQGSVNIDASDLTDPAAPRFRLNANNVEMAGVVLYTGSGSDPVAYNIAQGTIGPEYIKGGQQFDYLFSEATYWSNVASVPLTMPKPPGWLRSGLVIGSSDGYLVLSAVTGGSSDPIPAGLAISLAGIFWPVG